MAILVPKSFAYPFFTIVGAFSTVVTGGNYYEDPSDDFLYNFFIGSIVYTLILGIFTYTYSKYGHEFGNWGNGKNSSGTLYISLLILAIIIILIGIRLSYL
jgi:hypothetical protein